MFRLPNSATSVRQSEILSDVVERRANLDALKEQETQVDKRSHPYAIIITQDCDLDWDFRNRSTDDGVITDSHKKIPSILFCEVETAERLRGKEKITSAIWKKIQQNKDERYHFISSVPAENDLVGEGLPELAIDFKRYFTIPTAELYWQIETNICSRRAWLNHPYLEHLSHRFANFLSRIALPHDYESQ